MAVSVQQLQTDDDAYVKQATDAQNAKQSQEALQSGEKPEPSFVSKFMTSVGRASTNTLDWAVSAADSINVMRDRAAHDIGAGIVTGATNIADAVGSAVSSSGKGLAAAEDPAHAEDAQEGSLPTSPIWDHAKGAILDFRDAVAVKDPTLSDNLLQGAAQLAVPFAGYSRAMAGVHGFANMVAAGAAADATALGPHDPRMADLIALGRHTEGKFGETLRTLAPDGGAVNAYINYLTDRGDETEAAGRFKNVLDGFGANMLVTPLLHAVAAGLKYGTAGLRHAVENGVGSASDLMPAPQAGRIGSEPMDMSLTPEQRALERERVAAARDREEGVTQQPTPEPIPANAAAREGAAARRDAADTPAALSADDEAALRDQREFLLNPPAVPGRAAAQPINSNVVDMFSRRGYALTKKPPAPSVLENSTTDYGPEGPTAAMKIPAGPGNDVTKNADGTVTASSGAFPTVTASAADMSAGIAQNRATTSTLRDTLTKFNEQNDGAGVPLHDEISKLNSGLSRNTPQGAFYGEVLDKLQAKGLSTKLVPTGTGTHGGSNMLETSGTYDPKSDTMAVHAPPLLTGSNQSVLHTFVHEAVHAATINEARKTPAVMLALDDLKSDAEMSGAVRNLKQGDRYGLTDWKEFTAEAFANPRFRKALQDSPGEHGSLWDDFKVTVGGILGISGAAVMAPQFDKLLTKEKTGA